VEKRPVLWDVRDELYIKIGIRKMTDGRTRMDVATVMFENFSDETQTEQKVIRSHNCILTDYYRFNFVG